MKKILVMLSVVLFSVPAFALNAGTSAGKDCNAEKAAFEQHVNSLSKDSFIVQYILINLADPVKEQKLTDAQFFPLAQCYNTYRVRGVPMVDFVQANADIFRQNARPKEERSQVYDELRAELLDFANRVERLSEQAALDDVASHGNDDWVVEHILGNLADPMSKMTDEQAAPKASVYKQLKVKDQSLVEFSFEQAQRFKGLADNVEKDLTSFAKRVESLAD